MRTKITRWPARGRRAIGSPPAGGLSQRGFLCQTGRSLPHPPHHQVGRTKCFLRFPQLEHLNEKRRQTAEALVFFQRIVRGHVAREQHQARLEEKRKQDAVVAAFLSVAEVRSGRRWPVFFIFGFGRGSFALVTQSG